MILLKKAIRSMLRNKKSYISCIVLMLVGIMMFVSMNTAMDVIDNSKNYYYTENSMADAFATVTNIPADGIAQLESIPGIKKVDGRIVNEYEVYSEDGSRDLVLKLISTKIDDNTRINNYNSSTQLKKEDEILIGETFFTGNDLHIGENISFIMNSRLVDFNVAGTVTSPEYIFIMKSATDFLTDTSKYNIGYIEESIYKNITQGDYNDLVFLLEAGVEYKDVENEIKYTLQKYGLISLYPKKDQPSYSMLETELQSNKSTASSIPVVFVSMASIMLYLMLKRIIEQDRSQIGMMKAFGYSNGAILLHYIFYGFITGFIGGGIGVISSSFSIKPLVNYFTVYYNLPIHTYVSTYSYYIMGIILSVGGGVLGGFYGAKSILSLSPSEAMRSKAPKLIKNDLLKKVPFLKYFLTNGGIMAVRNIGRNKVRSSFIVVGIIFSYGMMSVIVNMSSAMDGMFYNQYNLVMKYDGEIILKDMIDLDKAISAIDNIDDINYSEGILSTGVSFYNDYKKVGTKLVGLTDNSQLYKIYDEKTKKNLKLKGNQVILASNIANKINTKKGDYIYASSSLFHDDIKLYVSDIANQTVGFEAYIDFVTLNNMIGKKDMVNSIIFYTNNFANVKSSLLNANNVIAVSNKKDAQKSNEDLLQSYSGIIEFIQFMTIILAFSIIYNTSSISLSERSREYATLRIMGMEIKEVCDIMNFEYWILCIIGILLGYPFAIYLSNLMQNMVDIESFSMPSTVSFSSQVAAAIGCIVAVMMSNFYSKRVIKKLDLVEVLKERE